MLAGQSKLIHFSLLLSPNCPFWHWLLSCFLCVLLVVLTRNVNIEKYTRIFIMIFDFQEWVTDSPFVISPRITFEVSVRLLGGLMALGYTIASILKRTSHVFVDDRVCVKIDWLEQIGRHYVQVSQLFPSLCHYFCIGVLNLINGYLLFLYFFAKRCKVETEFL